jgi:hypothetical protein
VVGIDATYALELLVAAIKSWPFTHRSGEPVEISAKNLRAMGADVVDAILLEINKLIAQEETEQPSFETASGDPS